jgi:ABC-type transporter Mla maintaining outer membrane lipid asymmetry ATPase subunit MlaF
MSAAPQPPAPVIEMRGVSVGAMRDQNTVVVESADWTVAAGDFWALGGLQGSGKTDFLLMTGGLMAPLSGTYRFFGQEMPIFDEERLADRLQLGLVFDGGQLFHHLTVGENIALPMRYHRNLTVPESKDALLQMLELTELGPWADSTPGAINRNWQKRVGLARALMLRPRVLLLDNPLAGLDLRHRGWWLSFLSGLSKGHAWYGGQPVTVVVTADDLRPWRKRARHFAVLNNKRLQTLGTWEQVEKMADEHVQELLAMASTAG